MHGLQEIVKINAKQQADVNTAVAISNIKSKEARKRDARADKARKAAK